MWMLVAQKHCLHQVAPSPRVWTDDGRVYADVINKISCIQMYQICLLMVLHSVAFSCNGAPLKTVCYELSIFVPLTSKWYEATGQYGYSITESLYIWHDRNPSQESPTQTVCPSFYDGIWNLEINTKSLLLKPNRKLSLSARSNAHVSEERQTNLSINLYSLKGGLFFFRLI